MVPQFLTRIHSSINVITICSKKPKKSRDNKPGENGVAKTSTKDEDHHTMVEVEREHKKSEEEELEEKGEPKSINQPSPPDPSISFITGKVHKLNSKLDPRKDPNRGVSNFTGRIKGMHIFVRNFTYVSDFMIVEDISSIIDPRLSQVVLGKPFVVISNMTHDLSLGVVRFTNGINEIAYKMFHKIERYNSLSYLEKEHTKSVYFRNEEDKRRGVDYVMSKILGFYKECLELGPEYLIRLKDEGGVTFTKLINDMRNIKLTMPKMQLNSKFVNNMFPEWDIFMTTVKLNRGLKTSNYDQLYAYLKQHEAHVNENKMMLERYTQHAIDPLVFVSNVSPHWYPLQSSANPQSAYNRVGNAHPGQAGQAKPIKCYNCNGIGHIARQCTHSKQPHNSKYFKDKMLLMQAKENGVVLDEKQLLFIAGGQTNTFDDVDEAPLQYLELNEDNVFQADQYGAFDYDVDEAPTAQTMFMVNLSSVDRIYDEAGPSYDSNILSEVQDHDNYPDNVDEYHEVHECKTMHNQTTLLTQMLNIRVILILFRMNSM
ncbi:integrase, catalytic region, zinc finger, CCHC-type containing protein [Tanacetum coccineum]